MKEPPTEAVLLLQLFPNAVAVLNMLHLELVEVVHKPLGFRGVVNDAG
jgi:hypothetical protein